MPERLANRFLIKRELGRGNMGRVYLAEDEKLARSEVALKVIDMGMEDAAALRARERFAREAALARKIHSQHIVTIYDIVEDGDLEFIVMEYLEGDDLKRIIREQRPLSLVQKLDIVVQACDGLNAAHKVGIVHRDVKPANIMVLTDGGTVKLVDFGIAGIGTNPFKSIAFLTPAYSSPEQVKGDDNLDRRTDIFSLGIVLYELASYQHPFLDPSNPKTVERRIQSLQPQPLSSLIGDCPRELDKVAQQALAKSPADRYQTAERMAFELIQVAASLKRDTIEKLLREAKQYLEKNSLDNAEDCYRRVLEIEPNQSEARTQLQEIQEKVGTKRRSEPMSESLHRGSKALESERFDEAISEFSRVLRSDPKHEEARKGREGAEKGQRRTRYMEQARRFCAAGDFKSAKKDLQSALNIDRDYEPALQLLHEVEEGLHEQEQRRQVQQTMESARRFIAERSHSRALDALTRAQELDPANPEVEALIRSAREGLERDERQHRLRKLCSQIQDALNREQFAEAERLAGEARQEFPDDSQLLRLYEQANRRAELQRKRRYVDQEHQAAREFFQKGQLVEAVTLLKRALEIVPGEPVLTALLRTAEEAQARAVVERAVHQAHEQASELMRSADYPAAIEVLEAALGKVGRSPELSALLEAARGLLSEQRQQEEARVRQVLDRARSYAQDGAYANAVQVLEQGLQEQKSEEMAKLLVALRERWQSFDREREEALARARELLATGDGEAALVILNNLPKAYTRSKEFQQLFAECRQSVDRATTIRNALTQVEKQIKSGAPDKAWVLLEAALRVYPDERAFHSLSKRFEVVRHRLRQARLEKLLTEARAAMGRMEYGEVISLLNSVSPDWEDPAGLIAEANTLLKEGLEFEDLPWLGPLFDEAHSLLEKAHSLQKDLNQRRVDIQDAIGRGDFNHALDLAKKALSAFPEHPQLRRLERDADRLADAQRKRSYVEEQLKTAQDLTQQGRLEEAEIVLKGALKSEPEDPGLNSLLRTIQQSQAEWATQSQVKKVSAEAEEQIRDKNFEGAIAILEKAQADRGSSTELSALLGLARAELAEQQRRRERVERALARAEAFRRQGDFLKAIEELERDREELGSREIDELLASVRREWHEFEAACAKLLQGAHALLEQGRAEEALKKLDEAPESYSRGEEFQQLHEECRIQIERERLDLREDLFRETRPVAREKHSEVEPSPEEEPLPEVKQPRPTEDHRVGAPEPQRPVPSAVWWAGTSAIVMLTLVVTVVLVRRGSHQPPLSPPTAPPQTGYVELNPMPWAEVLSVRRIDHLKPNGPGTEVKLPNVPGQAPLRLDLAPGDYRVELRYKGEIALAQVTVKLGEAQVWQQCMPGFDVDAAIDELVK